MLDDKKKLINIINQLPEDTIKELLEFIKKNYMKGLENNIDLDKYFEKITTEDNELLEKLSE